MKLIQWFGALGRWQKFLVAGAALGASILFWISALTFFVVIPALIDRQKREDQLSTPAPQHAPRGYP